MPSLLLLLLAAFFISAQTNNGIWKMLPVTPLSLTLSSPVEILCPFHFPLCFSYLHGKMKNQRGIVETQTSPLACLGSECERWRKEGGMQETHSNKFNKNK